MLFEIFSACVKIQNTYRTCGYGRMLIIVL